MSSTRNLASPQLDGQFISAHQGNLAQILLEKAVKLAERVLFLQRGVEPSTSTKGGTDDAGQLEEREGVAFRHGGALQQQSPVPSGHGEHHVGSQCMPAPQLARAEGWSGTPRRRNSRAMLWSMGSPTIAWVPALEASPLHQSRPRGVARLLGDRQMFAVHSVRILTLLPP